MLCLIEVYNNNINIIITDKIGIKVFNIILYHQYYNAYLFLWMALLLTSYYTIIRYCLSQVSRLIIKNLLNETLFNFLN